LEVPNERSRNRIGRVVRRAEQRLFGDSGDGYNREGGTTTHVLKIQSGAANAFGYPARIQKWSDSAGTWSDFDTTEVRVEDPNGQTLAADQYVVARAVGVNTSNVGCFATTGILSGSTPAFSGARVTKSSGQNMAQYASVVITFDTEEYDTDAYHSTTSNTSRLTVPTTGYYSVGAYLPISEAGATLPFHGLLHITKNGGFTPLVSAQGFTHTDANALDWDLVLTCATEVYLTAGDYVEVIASQGASTTQQAMATSKFWISWLGL